jgi:SET domain
LIQKNSGSVGVIAYMPKYGTPPARTQILQGEHLRQPRKYWLFALFLLAFLVGFVGIVLSMFHRANLAPGDGAALFAALLAGAVVWWQGHLIKQQMELQAALELNKEWNSKEMLETRSVAWNDACEPDEDMIEGVLEFFEKVSSFEKRGVISISLIWDTFGWYMWRYYHYSRPAIEKLRRRWTPERPDQTLYQDLEALFPSLMACEIKARNCVKDKREPSLTQGDILRELDNTKRQFVAAEKGGECAESPPKVLIELKPSGIDADGVGVFAISGIPEGQKVADGIAEADFQRLVPWTKFDSYDTELQRKVRAFCVGTPGGFLPPEKLDFNKLSIEWYLNHSCDGNVGFNDDGDFVAIKDIGKGDELAYDYGLVESNPKFSMNCTCRNENCREVVTGNDWKNPDFVKKHRHHMHPRLRRLLDDVS